jgi:hypothetical protein
MSTKTEALDIDQCVYDNCYDRVYGVVQIPFDTEMFEGDSTWLCEKKHRLYVNTPLCKAHFKQVPATAYIWKDKDWNVNE